VDLISQRSKLFLFSSSFWLVTNQKTYRTNIVIWGQLQEGTTMAAGWQIRESKRWVIALC